MWCKQTIIRTNTTLWHEWHSTFAFHYPHSKEAMLVLCRIRSDCLIKWCVMDRGYSCPALVIVGFQLHQRTACQGECRIFARRMQGVGRVSDQGPRCPLCAHTGRAESSHKWEIMDMAHKLSWLVMCNKWLTLFTALAIPEAIFYNLM